MTEPSIQQRFFPELTCFGCGPANPRGLRISSYPDDDGDGTTASFVPWPEHDNGLGYLNGGIIATLLDCHSATPVLMESERLGLMQPSDALAYVTAGIDVRYLRPTPLEGPLTVRARLASASEDVMAVDAEIWADGKLRATGASTWKRWRPRT
ncbi:MAG: PaaI family thioesterase [Actinobacteria bacterium]|nr:PaaI family thioesterase [Actinomycetota bacterium]